MKLFNLHKPHSRTNYSFSNRCRINRIVLVRFDVGLDELSGPNVRSPAALRQPLRAGAGFQPDQC